MIANRAEFIRELGAFQGAIPSLRSSRSANTLAAAFAPIPLFPPAGGRIAGNGAGPAAAVSAIFYRHRFRGFITRLDAVALALTRIGCSVAGITFTPVRGCIAGARTGIGRAHTRIRFGIAGASARIGRTFARIGCSVAGIAFTPVRGCVRRVSAILAFLLIGVFLTRALIGTFTRVRRRVRWASAAVRRALARVVPGIFRTRAILARRSRRAPCTLVLRHGKGRTGRITFAQAAAVTAFAAEYAVFIRGHLDAVALG